MAHIHSVYDTEPHFQIDKTSREIKNVSNSKTTITQFDHNSERFTFEIPRFIDGHDMSLCNKVQVHYINIDSTDKTNKISGVYTVEDLQLSPEDEDIVICSWLISQNATQLAGSLVFLLRFACVTDDVLDYAWNTTKCTTISVSNGLYNGEAIIEEYFDILSVWEQNIIDDVTLGIDQTIEEKVDNIKLVETATGNAITIDSSEAPIPYLKLSGKTTQNGTPTPETPVPMVSVGDSGSFTVKIQGENVEEQTLTMPYPLRSYNGVQDEIDFARGVLIQRCYMATDFSFNFELENVNVYRASKPYPTDYANALCSHTNVNENTNNDNTHFYIGSSAIWVYLPKDVEAANIQVMSRLETPIEIPLNETELNAYRQLYTYKGKTTILSESDMEILYYVNKPNAQFIGNIHTQINKDYLKLHSTLQSEG